MKLLAASARLTSAGVTPSEAMLGRIEPDAHGESLAAEDLRVGDAVDRLQARLDDARQIVGDLRSVITFELNERYIRAKP